MRNELYRDIFVQNLKIYTNSWENNKRKNLRLETRGGGGGGGGHEKEGSEETSCLLGRNQWSEFERERERERRATKEGGSLTGSEGGRKKLTKKLFSNLFFSTPSENLLYEKTPTFFNLHFYHVNVKFRQLKMI